MFKISHILLLVIAANGTKANIFKANAFLSRMMSGVSGEPALSQVIIHKQIDVDQYLDHMDLSKGTFKQKVLVYDEFYLPGGPIFVLISTRDDFLAYWMENSIPIEIVKQKRGVLYGIEPRYHGGSRPTADTSTSNLQNYFTLEKIIMDNVVLINYFKTSFEEAYGSTKLILFGYDTGATLAAWIYSLYPGLVSGVWASSAPMYPSTELSTYFSDVQTTIGNLNPTCHERLAIYFAELETLITAEQGSLISQYFNMGDSLSPLDTNDISLFYYALLSGIGSIVEYGNFDIITDFCAELESGTAETNVEILGNYFKEFFQGELLTYANFVNYLKSDSWDSDDVINGERQQLFQSCSYLSWFRTSTHSSSFFNVNLPLEFYMKLCKDVFNIQPGDIIAGNDLTAAAYKLNTGLTNIYFTNGALDPFRQVGVTSEIGTQASTDLILTVGKASDFRQINELFDSEQVVNVKLKVKSLLESWIN